MTNPSLLIVPDRFKASKLYSQLPQDGSGDFVVTRATTAYRTNAAGILESVANNVPRLDFPIGSGCPALLVEPAATNLLLRSEDFRNIAEGGASNTWTPNDTTIVSTNNLAPNGTNTATRITGNGANKARQQVFTGTIGQLYTGSFWVRRVSGTGNVQLRVGDVSSFLTITPTSTWQRFSFSAAPTTTTVRLAFISIVDLDEFEIWGAQLETGSVATSYIPTVAAAATRNADVINKTAVSGLIGQTEGTLYAEVDISRQNFNTFLSISDGTLNNRIQILFLNATTLRALIRVSNVEENYQVTIPSIPLTGGIFKIGLGYKANDYCLALNGTTYANTSSRPVPACNQIRLGANAFGDVIFNDRIRTAALYTTRLSNAQLQFLTTL